MIYNLGLLRYIFLRGFPQSLLARRLVTIALCITNTCLGFLVKYCKIRNWLCISNGEWGTGVVVNCYAGGKTKTTEYRFL